MKRLVLVVMMAMSLCLFGCDEKDPEKTDKTDKTEKTEKTVKTTKTAKTVKNVVKEPPKVEKKTKPGAELLAAYATKLEALAAAGDVSGIEGEFTNVDFYKGCTLMDRHTKKNAEEAKLTEDLKINLGAAKTILKLDLKKQGAKGILGIETRFDEKPDAIFRMSEYYATGAECKNATVAKVSVYFKPEAKEVRGFDFTVRGGVEGWKVETISNNFHNCAEALYKNTFACKKLAGE